MLAADVELLGESLRAGQDPNLPDRAGRRPIHLVSIADEEAGVEMIHLLAEAGADVNAPLLLSTPIQRLLDEFAFFPIGALAEWTTKMGLALMAHGADPRTLRPNRIPAVASVREQLLRVDRARRSRAVRVLVSGLRHAMYRPGGPGYWRAVGGENTD